MLRQVTIPSEENSSFSFPVEFYGKEVEVLVYPFFNSKTNHNIDTLNDAFNKYLYSFNNYKFNRDEANNYE